MKYKNSLLGLFVAAVSAMLLSGCDVYQEGYSLQTDISECEASGANCETATGAGLLGIYIAGPDPYVINRANARRFDIQGLCNEGDFPKNAIEWSVYHTASNHPVHTNIRIDQGCVSGKFRFQVNLAGAYPSGDARYNERHTLVVEVIGKDINNTEHRNILAARREKALHAFE